MTSELISGDIFERPTEAIVNPVNCVGVMGAGLALQFKQRYPENYKAYRIACKSGELKIGKVFVFSEDGQKIINFPTKNHFREKSKMEYIESGLLALEEKIKSLEITAISIPALGCGLGGLQRAPVLAAIQKVCDRIPHVEFFLFGF